MREFVKTFLDFEASGLGSESYPIEIGVVGDNGEFSSLIIPAQDWTDWDEIAEELHGICRKRLVEEGRPAEQICSHLNTMLEGEHVWCDSHYDIVWLQRLYLAADMKPTFTLKNILEIIDLNLVDDNLIEKLDVTEHRALADAKVIKMIWEAFIDAYEKSKEDYS